jgi:protein-S-isoprenylcysteine O-methyltransferase Ste14
MEQVRADMGSLVVKAIAGLVFLLAVLGLLLFISAGTLEYWQAWVYLAVFGICTLFVTVYLIRNDPRLLASRVQAGPAAETQKSQKDIQGLASIAFIGVFIVSGLDVRFGWSNIVPVVSIISDGLVALGLFFVFLVFRENSFTSATIEVQQEQKVISTGPYSLVRHPMYAGAAVLLLFTPPALGSWVALVPAIGVILVIVVRLLDEEKFLAKNLVGYDVYREKVRYRLVPFVW